MHYIMSVDAPYFELDIMLWERLRKERGADGRLLQRQAAL